MIRALIGLTFVLIPPMQYRGDTSFTVVTRSQDATTAYCREWGSRPDAYACDVEGVVNMPNPCQWGGNDAYAQLLCHESGHHLGWPASHKEH